MSLYHWKNGQYFQAEYDIKQSIAFGEKTVDKGKLSSLYGQLGSIYRAQNKYDEAIKYYLQSADLLDKKIKEQQFGFITMWNNIGEAYRAAGQYDKALPYLLEADSINVDDNRLNSDINQNLGMVYVGLGNYSKAEEAYLKAIKAAQDPKAYNAVAAVDSMYSLCVLYGKERKLSEASATFNDAVILAKSKLGDEHPMTKKILKAQQSFEAAPLVQWDRLMAAGNTSMNAQQYIQAVSAYEKALLLSSSTPDSLTYGITLSSLGAAYLRTAQFSKAEAMYTKALPLYQKYLANEPQQIKMIEDLIAISKAKKSTAPVGAARH